MKGYNVNFLKQKLPTWKFIFLEAKDKVFMMTSKIALCLLKPDLSGNTELSAKAQTLDVNLSYYAFVYYYYYILL